MKSIILDVAGSSKFEALAVESDISFRKYIAYLAEKKETVNSLRKSLFEDTYNKLVQDPKFLENIPLHEVSSYEEQLNLIFNTITPLITDETKLLWALSTPLRPELFFGTPAFYNLASCIDMNSVQCGLLHTNAFSIKEKLQSIYSFILEELYEFPIINKYDMIVDMQADVPGLNKYFRLNVDNSFASVYPKGELPILDFELVRRKLQESLDVEFLSSILPLSLFRFEGFSIVTLTDVTAESAVENLKNIILNRNTYNSKAYYGKLSESLKMLVQNPKVEFGLMPMLKVNNKLIFNKSTILHSKLIDAALEDSLSESAYLSLAEEYYKKPKVIFMSSFTEEDEKHDFIRILKNDGVKSYALIPIFRETKMMGILELYANEADVLDEKTLAAITPALPLIEQVLTINIEDFHVSLENVVKEKFTSIQPAVQWKFKEAAWHYLRDKTLTPKTASIESINFKNVYPLYGAVDIRNSTIERNLALQIDLKLQFEVLIETFAILKKELGFTLADEMVFKCKKWLAKINENRMDNDELKVREFLDLEVHPFLLHFKENQALAKLAVLDRGPIEESSDLVVDAIDRYLEITDEETGEAYAQRRALELSMQKVNSAVNLYLDLFKNEIQTSYPTYFEKFRTDGVEYDIYIGQSIQPDKPFNQLYLKNIRLWQLTSMAAIARITNSLIPQMEKPLLTTQLIFIHANSIDISFRDDERRFDVEGSYNIRYQIIKKRIDKVHIKGTDERLTQPGKIALIYFNSKAVEEYVDFIKYLQEQNTLLDDLEYLDLEDLQGITGLKALRIGVNLDTQWN